MSFFFKLLLFIELKYLPIQDLEFYLDFKKILIILYLLSFKHISIPISILMFQNLFVAILFGSWRM